MAGEDTIWGDTVDDMMSLMKEVNPDEQIFDMTEFLFEGFDPEIIMKELLSICKKKKITKKTFKSDMSTLIAICCNRGPINSKIKNRTSPEGVTRMNELIAKYNLKTDITSRDISRTDITPSRIVNVFPLATVDICHKSDYARDFSGPFNSMNIPQCMKNTCFSACIPSGKKSSELLLKVYMLYVMDLSVVTQGIDPDKFADSYNKQLNFVKAAMNAKKPPNDLRMQKLTDVGLLTRTSYTSLVELSAGLCEIMSWEWKAPTFAEFTSDLSA